jgi:hypothetical protein
MVIVLAIYGLEDKIKQNQLIFNKEEDKKSATNWRIIHLQDII